MKQVLKIVFPCSFDDWIQKYGGMFVDDFSKHIPYMSLAGFGFGDVSMRVNVYRNIGGGKVTVDSIGTYSIPYTFIFKYLESVGCDISKYNITIYEEDIKEYEYV